MDVMTQVKRNRNWTLLIAYVNSILLVYNTFTPVDK